MSLPGSTGEPLGLLLDEDVHHCLAFVLRASGFEALTVAEAGLGGASDEKILEYTSERGLAVLTYDYEDWESLHDEWRALGRDHAGIIVSYGSFPGYGRFQVLVDRTTRLLSTLRTEDMRNERHYLETFS